MRNVRRSSGFPRARPCSSPSRLQKSTSFLAADSVWESVSASTARVRVPRAGFHTARAPLQRANAAASAALDGAGGQLRRGVRSRQQEQHRPATDSAPHPDVDRRSESAVGPRLAADRSIRRWLVPRSAPRKSTPTFAARSMQSPATRVAIPPRSASESREKPTRSGSLSWKPAATRESPTCVCEPWVANSAPTNISKRLLSERHGVGW